MTEEAGGLKLSRRRRAARGAVMTADEYRELIRALVDQAGSDFSIAERLAEEARLRFAPEIHVAGQPDDETCDDGAAPATEHRGGDR
jgi:hypothetical protein